MQIENSLDNVIEHEKPVVLRNLVKTTQEVSLQYILALNNDTPLYFVSGCFADDYKLNIRGKNISYISLKQSVQYSWVSHKLGLLASNALIQNMAIIFEQTKHGSIHYHAIAQTAMHKHDLRAIICELFGFVRANDIIINVNVQKITNIKDLCPYLFDKKGTKKEYEILDMTIFKPMILK